MSTGFAGWIPPVMREAEPYPEWCWYRLLSVVASRGSSMCATFVDMVDWIQNWLKGSRRRSKTEEEQKLSMKYSKPVTTVASEIYRWTGWTGQPDWIYRIYKTRLNKETESCAELKILYKPKSVRALPMLWSAKQKKPWKYLIKTARNLSLWSDLCFYDQMVSEQLIKSFATKLSQRASCMNT